MLQTFYKNLEDTTWTYTKSNEKDRIVLEDFQSVKHCSLSFSKLKGHVALEWASWSIKAFNEPCIRKAFVTICYKMHGQKDVLKVEYNDPHKYASKLYRFPFTL